MFPLHLVQDQLAVAQNPRITLVSMKHSTKPYVQDQFAEQQT